MIDAIERTRHEHEPPASPFPGDGPAAPSAGPPWIWPALILLIAAILRFVGLGWGLPDIDVRPDEELTVAMALKFGTGDLNPHWFWYPTLQGYLLFACDIVLVLYWLVTGVIKSPGDIVTRYAEDPSAFYLIARSVSAISGTATVGLVYLLGRRAYGTAVGLTAALIMAVAFLPVRDSHFGTVDPPMIALAMLASLAAWSIYERPTRRSYLAAGMFVGLAASSKYYGVFAALAVFAAHALRPRREGEPRRLADLVLSGLCCVGAFVATSPFTVIAFPEFLRDLENVRTIQSGLSDEHLSRAWIVHLLYSLPRGLTWPIYLAAIGGLIGLLVSDTRRSLVLFAYPVVFFAAVGASWAAFARYVTPIVPFLALAAGWFACRAATAIANGFGGGDRAARWLGAGITAAACIPTLIEDGYLFHHLRAPDSRREAANWVRESVPDGSTIGWLGSIYGRPPLPQSPQSLERRLDVALGKGSAGILTRKRIELARSGPRPQYLLIDLPREPKSSDEDLPEYLMLERYPLFYARKQVAFADDWLRLGGYREIRDWAVTDREGPFPYSDPQDAVYLPYGQLGHVYRSGPRLILYRRGTAPSAAAPIPDVPRDTRHE
jgi:Dolichyl-phosphate-mannose-protein mannosyltransferase